MWAQFLACLSQLHLVDFARVWWFIKLIYFRESRTRIRHKLDVRGIFIRWFAVFVFYRGGGGVLLPRAVVTLGCGFDLSNYAL